MLQSNGFGCGPGCVVEHSRTETWSVFRAPSLPASLTNPDTREMVLKKQVQVAQTLSRDGQRRQTGLSVELCL